MNSKRLLALLLTAVLVVSLLAGCGKKTVTPSVNTDVSAVTDTGKTDPAPEPEKKDGDKTNVKDDTGTKTDDKEHEAVSAGEIMVPRTLEMTTPSSYKELGQALVASRDSYRGGKGGSTVSAAAVDEAVPEESASYETAAGGAGDGDNGVEYYSTNIQTEGIDEGDIVKTDGEYIYVIHQLDFIIFKADGENTRELGKVIIGSNYYKDSDSGKYDWESEYRSPYELYVYGDTVAVLTSYSYYHDYMDSNENWHWDYVNRDEVDFIDVSDPMNPTVISTMGQDGNNISSRMKDGKLYVLSNYYVYDYDEDNPRTYVPSLYDNGKTVMCGVDCIHIIPGYTVSEEYVIISEYDMTTGQRTRNESLLGGGSSVYMSTDNIYLLRTNYRTEESEPYNVSVYEVVDCVNYSETCITRIDVSGGGLTVASTGTVPGYYRNQFSFDEYEGYLRAVTTTNYSSYKIYTDKAMEFTNYKWDEQKPSTNSFYVLDRDMNVVGKIEGLGEGERVYSARYQGDMAYFVTFESVDPLFAVDASDPTNPAVTDALEMPGFSDYLHVWSDGLMFGLGYNTEEKSRGDYSWITTGNIKLCMYDVSDSGALKEIAKYDTDFSYSPAMDNHKALLIAPDKGLIGLPVDEGYAIYSYGEGGFTRLAFVDNTKWDWISRGLYIGDYFYIITSEDLTVLDLVAFKQVKKLTIAAG